MTEQTKQTRCPICDTGEITLIGMDGERLMVAFQVLRQPSGFRGMSHRDAIECIKEIVGVVPAGRPTEVEPGAKLEAYVDWLCINHQTPAPGAASAEPDGGPATWDPEVDTISGKTRQQLLDEATTKDAGE